MGSFGQETYAYGVASLIGRAAAALGVLTAFIGCANLLDYDSYHARGPSSDAAPEIAVDSADDVALTDDPIHPPPRPPGMVAPSGKGRTLWLVVNHFYLNQQSVGGTGTDQPWRGIGYDLDGQCTGERESRENLGTCQRVAGGPQDVLIDGDRCRDNNFGSQIVPLVSALDPNYERSSNEGIARGATTWILQLEDLDDGPNDPFVVGRMYKAAAAGEFVGEDPPRFDGTDVREIDMSSLIEGDLARPRTVFTQGYLADNVFVSGEPRKLDVTIPIQAIAVPLPVVGGILTLRLNPDHTLGELGLLAGAIRTTDTEAVLQPIAEQGGICPGVGVYNNFVRNIKRIMDVVADAPGMHNPNVTCDACSLGIAFTAVGVRPPVHAVPPYVAPSRCASSDAGADG